MGAMTLHTQWLTSLLLLSAALLEATAVRSCDWVAECCLLSVQLPCRLMAK